MHASPVWRTKPQGARAFGKRTGVVLLLAAAAISLAVGIVNLRTSQRLIADGLISRARVFGKHAERSRSWTRRYVDIQYQTTDGQTISTRDDVARALYDRIRVSATITVRYLPDEPDVHTLGATARRDTFMLWIAGLWLVLAGVYWMFGT
jgi:hypothetical protein